MQRRPEPELMNDAAQVQAYAEADFTEPHEAFVRTFAECFPDLTPRGTYLDLGCGPGDVTLRFAKRFSEVRVDGVDGADRMLAHGTRVVAAAGLASRIRFLQRTLPTPGPWSRYDGIISNSLLHHLHDPRVLWQTIRAAGAPAAPVFVMDLMRPVSEADAARLVDENADGEPEVLRHDFYHSLLAAYQPDEVRAQLAEAGLALEVRPSSDRHLIAWGRLA